MAAGPSNNDISDLPAAGAEQDDKETDVSDKPAGWFEAQRMLKLQSTEEKTDDEKA